MITYDTTTKRITATGSGYKAVLKPADGELFLNESGSILGHYVNAFDVIAEKTEGALSFDVATIDADLVDTATIAGIPAHTLVTWPDGETTEINDGVLEFAVDLAGTYTFTIDSVAHLIQEVSIEALATA